MKKRAPSNGKKLRREFSVVIERDQDGWFVASVPELRGCHTQARSLDTLIRRTREAINACLDSLSDQPQTTFIGLQRIAV
ncbi:MAG: type II toxin-antitoxin system HicB family antitoxin [Phycisphaeraceae bacterium]|nr:type II toxin-antitoxin system HicB family antitoxin [Phycisphaeraceae bacterium]